jgi:hypothetical protein
MYQSNYFHVWQFLQLPPRSSIADINTKGHQVCSQSWDDLVKYNSQNKQERSAEDQLTSLCFQSAYVYSILRYGYGFQDSDYITATDIINGQKVTWALGSILYEINTLPWEYIESHGQHHLDERMRENLFDDWDRSFGWFVAAVMVGSVLILFSVLGLHRKNKVNSTKGYEILGEVDDHVEIEKLPLRKK